MKIKVDFNREQGKIRALNGSNFGPNLSGQKNFNANEDFKALRIPYARLHDVPLAMVGNWHAADNYGTIRFK